MENIFTAAFSQYLFVQAKQWAHDELDIVKV